MTFGQHATYDKTKRYFSQTLFFATVLPCLMGLGILGLTYADPTISNRAIEDNPIRFSINLLAAIHVALTVYLFFDAAIRERIKSDPVKFIVVPTFIMLASVAMFTGNTEARAGHQAFYLAFFVLFVLAWNFWHFGKQNIGVFSYYRFGTGGRMLKAERRMIYLGAGLGAVAALIQGLDSYVPLYSSYAPFMSFLPVFLFISHAGAYVQYALTAVSVLYVLRYYARFNIKSALIFLVCVNFFLPIYLASDLHDRRVLQVFASLNISHGLQYVAFLLFHSFSAQEGVQRRVQAGAWSFPLMTLLLVVCALVLCEFYGFHLFIRHVDMSSMISQEYRTSLVDGLANGVLINHFWFDSFFWRFNNASARQWLLNRYHFLFAPR